MKTLNILSILTLLSFISCKGEEDTYVYPPVKLEFITAQTDATGSIVSLISDKGVTYPIGQDKTNSKLIANAKERIVCYYASSDAVSSKTESVDIYSLAKPISVKPQPRTDRITDPIDIQSIWLSGDYINITALIKAQNKTHRFDFIEDKITSENGVPTVHIILYHDNGGDMEAYTKKGYLSMPLENYIKNYPNGFNVSFSINTYKDGIKDYSFSVKQDID